ncbi:MAG: NERD domain-containing protein [Tessaracoccus sp.]|nr:NERD domain-containing protein [Tessaracoccus sp.]
MKLRYAGVCRVCGIDLPTRADAIYERTTKTVRCVDCQPEARAIEGVLGTVGDAGSSPTIEAATSGAGPGLSPAGEPESVPTVETPFAIDAGAAGSSARREYERRKAKDEERLRQKWGKLGGVAVALSEERQSTRAWAVGAVGEERLGARLDSMASESFAVLHDRRIPGSRANIDHMVVTTAGVWVIDAKRYRGRPQLRIEGGILRPRTEKVLVGGRDCTKLVDGVLKQVGLVREVVGDVPVIGALCFIDADWPLVGGGFTSRGVHALWPKRLYKVLTEETGATDVCAIHETLAVRFEPA